MKLINIPLGVVMNKITKKLNPVLLTALFATTAILSISQANAFERGGHRGAGGFDKIDVNQDGQLSLDELTTPKMSKAERKFSQKDGDDDGLISFEEFQQTRNGTMTDLSDIANEIVQCVADTKAETANDDIMVPTADKFISPTEKFAATDTSGDGFISFEELQDKVIEKVAASFLVMDQDADGLVTEDEYNAAKTIKKATKSTIRQCIEELNSEDII
jgi:Ca2+-binding EF-hand superfamily protein